MPSRLFRDQRHDRAQAHQAEMDPAGNFLFVPDLGTDRIFIFALDKQTGKLTPGSQPFLAGIAAPDGWMIRVGETLTQGDYPRHFDFEPNGNFCHNLNQRSDHVAIFRLDRMTGMVQFTNQFVPVGNPSKIVFLTL